MFKGYIQYDKQGVIYLHVHADESVSFIQLIQRESN